MNDHQIIINNNQSEVCWKQIVYFTMVKLQKELYITIVIQIWIKKYIIVKFGMLQKEDTQNMQKSEGKANAFETPQNTDQANALKQEEQKQGRDNKNAVNSFLHEQYKQLKETFDFRFFPSTDQQQNSATCNLSNLQNEQQILEGYRKVDVMNQNQQNILSPASENPLTAMLWALSCSGQLTDKFIESIEQVYVEAISKINQQSRQSDMDDHTRMHQSNLTDIDFLRQIKTFLQPSISIKKQIMQAGSPEKQFIRSQKIEDNQPKYKKHENISQQMTIEQFNRKSSITYYAHAKFLSFLNQSMEKLKVKQKIINFCHQNNTWPVRNNAIDFFRRLMAIKTFFPQLFPQIINQFKITIREFVLKTKTKVDQMYAAQMLCAKYLKCVKVYSQSDDILEAAKCIYNAPTKKSIKQKIDQLPLDQKVMKIKASESKRMEQDNEPANLIRPSRNQGKSNFFALKKMEGMNTKQKRTNIQFKKFNKNNDHWNPISQPQIFQLQVLEVENRQI